MSGLIPDYRWPSLADIPIEKFADKGFKGALLDIDNTFCPYDQYDEIPPENAEWVKRAEAVGVKCVLYSNATQWKIEKIGKISGLAGVPKAYKPSHHRLPEALELLGCTKDEALAIGDQAVTDILGGNLGGCTTILVEPYTEKDWPGTKLLRLIEMCAIVDRRPWNRHKPKVFSTEV